jgi:ATP-dependent Clp protease ATP-binding subunit ClpC
MTEHIEQQTLALLTCPTCNGTGRLRTSKCESCAGMGLGAFHNNEFLYFSLPLSPALIRMQAVKKSVDSAINILCYLVGLLGVIALGFWLYEQGDIVSAIVNMTPTALKKLIFWKEQHWLLFCFWLSLIPDMYALYRVTRARQNDHKIKAPVYHATESMPAAAQSWDEIKKHRAAQINTAEGVDPSAAKVFEEAYMTAARFSHNTIEPLHIFTAALFTSGEVGAVFSRLTINEKKFVEGLEHLLHALPQTGGDPVFGALSKEVAVESYTLAWDAGQEKLRALDLIMPAYDRDPKLKELLYDLEIDRTKLANAVAWFRVNNQILEQYKLYKRTARFKPSSNMDRAYTAIATPLLDSFSHDWTLAAKWGRVDMCVARDQEIRQIFDAVESGRFGMIMVGPEGVGKESVIGGIARLMVTESVPRAFQDKRLIEVDVPRLIGGSNAAQAEERLLAVIGEVNRARNIILYMKDIEKIMGISSGGEESLDLASVLADAVSRGQIYCIASTTSENYPKYVEKSALGSAMAKIEVNEPDINRAILMIESKIGFFEAKYGVYFSYHALAEVVALTDHYIHDKYLPKKAIEVLESVAVKVSRRENKTVDREAIAEVITELTKIPVTKLTQDESKNLLNLEEKMHEGMIGQEEAVNMVSAALRRARVELREGKRPIANFLFLGPTGVGKTELAKTVAEVYFGREDYMIRLDMSEYQNKDSVSKMIGDQNGVQGYLTEAVRKMPFSLILLDEIEKAHPDILNLFLQVMDDGRLTDGEGRTIDFTSSILIATSNVGSALIQENVRAGKAMETIKEELIEKELVKAMRPELINRFDGVIIFKPLDQNNVIAIAKLMLKKIGKMLESKGYGFSISDKAIEQLATLGFEPEFGARPLRRLLQERVEDAIATKILEGGIQRRDTIVVDDTLAITIQKATTL